MNENEVQLDVKTIREMKKQLMSVPQCIISDEAVIDSIRVTVSGVVIFPNGCMHLKLFKSLVTPERYEEVLSRPRVLSAYDMENQ
jgi:hypothetical protein